VSRITWITLVAAVLGLLSGALAYALLDDGSTGSKTTTGPASVSRGFTLPLAGMPSTLALARHERNLLVGIVARSSGPVEVAALRGETPVSTDALGVLIDGREVEPAPCGRGCSRVEAPVLAGSPTDLAVRVGTSHVSFALPARLPPDGASVFGRARRTMDALHSFRFSERLTSGGPVVRTTFDVEAPNRLRFHTAGGFRTVIIGRNRWDYRAGRWERTPFPGLTLPDVLMWSGARHPRVVGRGPGGVTELAAFGFQPVPAWFRLDVAPSGRVLEAEMIAASHFMTHRYRDFNGGLSIEPPMQK
jgi:hypothetical protein